MNRRTRATIAGILLAAAGLTGCTAPTGRTVLDLCGSTPTQVDVYNYFQNKATADQQTITEGKELADNCQTVWSELTVEDRKFELPTLEQRSVTVLDMQFAGGGRRTIWVHRLVGHQAGIALLLDTGESFFLARQDIPPYYAAASHAISRGDVPKR